jgi:hypothetical protein
VVFPTLLAAGCHHLLHGDQLARALRLHGWPSRLTRPGSVLLSVAETTLGAAGSAGLVVGASVGPVIPLIAALLFSAYAADAVHILRQRAGGRGSQVPCGCGAVDHPVNQWVAVRAVAYVALAGLAALARPALTELAPVVAVTAAVAAVVIGLLLWLLPRTLAIPMTFLSGGAGPPFIVGRRLPGPFGSRAQRDDEVSRNQDPRSFLSGGAGPPFVVGRRLPGPFGSRAQRDDEVSRNQDPRSFSLRP